MSSRFDNIEISVTLGTKYTKLKTQQRKLKRDEQHGPYKNWDHSNEVINVKLV